MNKDKNVEVLAPAGNVEAFYSACRAGANAIYMGVDKFNARQMANNFDLDNYIKCIEYAHLLDIKVYLTLNTLLYDEEITEALEIVAKLYENGLDAVIVQDIGLLGLIHSNFKDLPIHASTQMSVTNIEQIKFLEKLGVKRVVLARELTLQEVEYICKNTNMEIEVFVHGALCVSVSGQCLFSSAIGNRSANRGSCAQPCRKRYKLYQTKNRVDTLLASGYLLSKKDIYGLEIINKLINIGVTSLKIEGRNKTKEYVYGVISEYREILNKNNIDDSKLKNSKYKLMQLFNRDGLSTGYFNGRTFKEGITLTSPKNTGIFLGTSLKSDKTNYIRVKLLEDIDLHDAIEVYEVSKETNNYSKNLIASNIITCIRDENFKIVNSIVKKDSIVYLGDIKKCKQDKLYVYKTSSASLLKDLEQQYQNLEFRKTIDVNLNIKVNEKIKINVVCNYSNQRINEDFYYEYVPTIAKSRAVSADTINEVFSKTFDTTFKINLVNCNIEPNLFIPLSILKDMKNNIIAKVANKRLTNANKSQLNFNHNVIKEADKDIENVSKTNENVNVMSIYKYNPEINYEEVYYNKTNKKLDIIYIPIHEIVKNEKSIVNKYVNNLKIYAIIPNVIMPNYVNLVDNYIESLISQKLVGGFIVGNIGVIEKLQQLRKKYSFELIADYSLNVFNKYSARLYDKLGFNKICVLPEMDVYHINRLSEKFDIEILSGLYTVMSSRYCIIGSFADKEANCKRQCKKGEYYILDENLKKYNLICNNEQCIMSIVRNVSNNISYTEKFKVRYSII